MALVSDELVQTMHKMLVDIHKLHFASGLKYEDKSLKDKFKAEILIGSVKKQRQRT
jgi:hypothetical protein